MSAVNRRERSISATARDVVCDLQICRRVLHERQDPARHEARGADRVASTRHLGHRHQGTPGLDLDAAAVPRRDDVVGADLTARVDDDLHAISAHPFTVLRTADSDEKPVARAMASIVIEVDVSSCWARSSRRCSMNRDGGTPTCSVNRWLSREGDRFAAAAMVRTSSGLSRFRATKSIAACTRPSSWSAPGAAASSQSRARSSAFMASRTAWGVPARAAATASMQRAVDTTAQLCVGCRNVPNAGPELDPAPPARPAPYGGRSVPRGCPSSCPLGHSRSREECPVPTRPCRRPPTGAPRRLLRG